MDESFEERIRDIRRRIAELRRNLYTTQSDTIERYETVVETPRTLEETRAKQNKEAELNDLREKLRRKK
jgi:hypothetical protein